MNIQPNNQAQAISDDQELAKALAGVSQAADDSLNFEETGAPAVAPVAPVAEPVNESAVDPVAAPAIPTPVEPVAAPEAPSTPTDPSLDAIKQNALNELRPLVGKLNVSPEEKFDTYLLLLRSTDDKELIGPAYEAASNIVDEARKAQALLDIIKEIDYLSAPKA